MRHTIHVLGAALICFAVSAGPSPLRRNHRPGPIAGNSVRKNATMELDARWLPWLGCWRSDAERLVSGDARLCVIPSSDHNPQAVRIVVIVGDAVATEQVMNADGSPIPINENGCTGDRRVSWSSRGTSRFSRVHLTCPAGPSPKASGLSLMTSGPLWLTVEVTQ